jgi:hypothetical protein
MRLFSLVLLFAAAVTALSSSGKRLCVILDEPAERNEYSKFLADLTGMSIKIELIACALHKSIPYGKACCFH